MHGREVNAGDWCLISTRKMRFVCSCNLEGVNGTKHLFYNPATDGYTAISSLSHVIGPLEAEVPLKGQMVLW